MSAKMTERQTLPNPGDSARRDTESFGDRSALFPMLITTMDFQCHSFSHCCSPAVVNLLATSGPAAVTGLVVPVVVDPVDREKTSASLASWSLAHVGEKVFERFPSLADGDAASTIVFPPWSVRVVTPEPHGLPCGVRGSGARTTDSVTVSKVFRRYDLALEAATAGRVPSYQSMPHDDQLIAAVTAADPAAIGSGFWTEAENQQTTVPVTSLVDCRRHTKTNIAHGNRQ